MAVENAQVTVGTTATQLTSAVNTVSAGVIVIANRGATAMFIGNSGVTTANGFRLDVNQTVTIEVNTGQGDAVYGVVAAATEPAHVLRLGR